MKVIVIVGMPAAGKNIASEYAKEHQFPYFSTGEVVRQEVKKRALNGDAENTAKISNELRGKDGLGVTRIVLIEAQKINSELVFLEGIRSWPEVEMIRDTSDCKVIAFVAPANMRLARVSTRGRRDDSSAHFKDRDWRELNYGVATCIALADEYILNTGTQEDAMGHLDRAIKSFIKPD
jgi:dephospho-CoA kinase